MKPALVPLSKVVQFDPPSKAAAELAPDSDVSFVPMSAVSESYGRIETEETRKLHEVISGYTTFERDDVLVAKITPCFENGKIALANPRLRWGFGSTEFHVLRALKDRLDPSYLLYFLRQPIVLRLGERRMTGTAGQKRVPRAFLEALPIPLVSLEQQRKIAGEIAEAESLRERYEDGVRLANDLVRSLSAEAFSSRS